MWVSGRDHVSWRQENNDRLTLVADKREYAVGDTASILVPHPYQGPVQALITVERGHIYRHWVQTLRTNSEQLNIPITEDLLPNVFVSVIIVNYNVRAYLEQCLEHGYRYIYLVNGHGAVNHIEVIRRLCRRWKQELTLHLTTSEESRNDFSPLVSCERETRSLVFRY